MSAKKGTAKANDAPTIPITIANADFETAMEAAGFGIFNILLLLAALPAVTAASFETSTMSYILPSAECDFKLTLLDKGILNGITYAGMISSALLWGYVADIKGRKKLLAYGYFVDVLAVLGSVFSQNKIQLMVFKYIGGFVICGPDAVLISYLTELHGRKYRDRVLMLLGAMFAIANVTLTVLALSVLPNNWDLSFFGLKLTSWQIFLGISAIPSVLASIFLSLFPESPKFLMSQQRNAEALQVFQKMYVINNRKSRDQFPIKELAIETRPVEISEKQKSVATVEKVKLPQIVVKPEEYSKNPKFGLRSGLQQIRPLFSKPYLGLSLQVYLLYFGALLGQNTMRLWLPPLFASIEEYERNVDGSGTSMCAILEYSVNKTNYIIRQTSQDVHQTCEAITTVASYTNNIVVAVVSFVGYIVAGFLVNRIGNKRITIMGLVIAGSSAALMYWSISAQTILVLSSIFVTVGSISGMSLIGSSVNLFPTSLRTITVSLAMMFGRCGSIVGNLLFPALMELGCIPPFVMISFVMYFSGLMSAFLPNSIKATLK